MQFNASSSEDSKPITAYQFDFGDGTNTTWLSIPEVEHFYKRAGNYSASVRIRDALNTSEYSAPINMTILNQAPTGDISFIDQAYYSGDRVRFEASGSDIDGNLTGYAWSVGGQSINVTGLVVNHTFTTSGTFTVVLTLTDDSGSQTVITKSITILNRAPTVDSLNIQQSKEQGHPWEFEFVVNASDADDTIDQLTFTWDLGDGSSATGAVVTHRYTRPGTFAVTVTVRDPGREQASRSSQVNVINSPPIIGVNRVQALADVGQVVTLDASSSRDPENRSITTQWQFNNKTYAGSIFQHIFDAPGVYQVRLTVSDEFNGHSTMIINVTVLDEKTTTDENAWYQESSFQAFVLVALIVFLIALAIITYITRRPDLAQSEGEDAPCPNLEEDDFEEEYIEE